MTLLSVVAPVASLAVPMWMIDGLPTGIFWMSVGIAAAIPLLIAPPISLFALSMLRLLTMTIDRVDDYVRFDALTGVLSRACLLSQIRERLSAGGVFLMVDADRFKSINDTYGHDVGDEALKTVASTLRAALAPDALIGRLGGEEFGVFLVGADEARGEAAAAAVCEAMRAAGAVVADRELGLTISVGCAAHRFGRSLEETMKLADQALYEAKHGGRDRYCVAAGMAVAPTVLVSRGMLAGA